MDNIFTGKLMNTAMDDREVEIVERKGLGHPDTICDTIVDKMTIELCNYYHEKYGQIQHHNLDKAFLVAGRSTPSFGGGNQDDPAVFYYGDRVTYADDKADIELLCNRVVYDWFDDNIPMLDIKVEPKFNLGSGDLASIFNNESTYLPSNDTSAAVGYAPLSKLENMIIDVEKYLNSSGIPVIGKDIKLMGIRKKDKVDLTVACAFVDEYVQDEFDYIIAKDNLRDIAKDYIDNNYHFKTDVHVNTLDNPDIGINGCYLTVSGTSAESGDSGQVGRGNNPAGVIPLHRPMSAEAASGKNPISHVGKIYNAFAFDIAKDIVNNLEGIKDAYVWMVSEIGRPINEPKIVNVQYVPGDIHPLTDKRIQELVEYRFAYMIEFVDKLIQKGMGVV